MPQGENRRKGLTGCDCSGLFKRFAALVAGDRSATLASYQDSLLNSDDPLIRNPKILNQILADTAEITDHLACRIAASGITDGVSNTTFVRTVTAVANRELSLCDLLRAYETFFDITIASLAGHVAEEPELLPCFVMAVRTLNQVLNLRLKQASAAQTRQVLSSRFREARIDERRRIARELHDRLGEGLSGALRQLELNDIVGGGQFGERAEQSKVAKDAIVEAMRRLRLVTSDLRQEPVVSLERGLTDYLESIATNAKVLLQIHGDDRWIAPSIADEAYLIIREAIRNALTHASGSQVQISIQVEPCELRAQVSDDGCGFGSARQKGLHARRTAGLATMKERATLLGGTVTVSSPPGQGTCVELQVPLPSARDDPGTIIPK